MHYVGKVRKVTPVVEPQERTHKRLNGRAKKRKQYNRRFNNKVQMVNGRIAGPNKNHGW